MRIPPVALFDVTFGYLDLFLRNLNSLPQNGFIEYNGIPERTVKEIFPLKLTVNDAFEAVGRANKIQ